MKINGIFYFPKTQKKNLKIEKTIKITFFFIFLKKNRKIDSILSDPVDSVTPRDPIKD